VIAIETAGPERLTFVHQIDTMEHYQHRIAARLVGKKCHTFGLHRIFISRRPRASHGDRASWPTVSTSAMDIDTHGFFDFA